MARAGSQPVELSTVVVHDRLRNAILRGELDPKVPISQVQLSARLGVSRTPLREALRMLQREGLIDSAPNRQVRVTELSVADLEQLYAARVLIESLALRITVPLYTPKDLADLKDSLASMTQLKGHDLDLWETAHKSFHRLLRAHAGDRIGRLAGDLSDHAERYRRVYMAAPRAWSAAFAEHSAIVEACVARNAAGASTALARHLARTALTLIAVFDPEHEPTTVREALRLVTAGADSRRASGSEQRTDAAPPALS
jgi:DNA-binding GntR family transcriptional regulator